MISEIRLSLLATVAVSALALASCSGAALVESSATAVTVRYGGGGIAEATRLAQQACDAHHKTARLRTTANFGLTEHYGHFDCF